MTEATAKPATARPARTRAATKATGTTAKPATAKAAPAPAEVPAETPAAVETPTVAAEPIKLVLVKLPDTKRYSVFAPDEAAESAGIVGKLYFPLGTNSVKVLATK